MSSAKLIGIILLVAGILLFVGAGAWGVTRMNQENAEGEAALTSDAFVLLLVLAAIPAIVLAAFGVVMLRQGAKEAVDTEEAARQRKILDMVAAQGEVQISDVAIELQSDTETIKDMLHRLVGMGVFSGYINWEKGVLYSVDASALRELSQCKNCGGDIKLTGKGVASCPWCGTEYFLK
jgi:hypothetical protein